MHVTVTQIWLKATEGHRTRWLVETLAGLVWPFYSLAGYPWGTVPGWLATIFWVGTGVSVVRVAGFAVAAYVAHEINSER